MRYRFSKATFVNTARLYSTNWLFLLFHLFLSLHCVCVTYWLGFTTPSKRN
jgi:hypothetical protein